MRSIYMFYFLNAWIPVPVLRVFVDFIRVLLKNARCGVMGRTTHRSWKVSWYAVPQAFGLHLLRLGSRTGRGRRVRVSDGDGRRVPVGGPVGRRAQHDRGEGPDSRGTAVLRGTDEDVAGGEAAEERRPCAAGRKRRGRRESARQIQLQLNASTRAAPQLYVHTTYPPKYLVDFLFVPTFVVVRWHCRPIAHQMGKTVLVNWKRFVFLKHTPARQNTIRRNKNQLFTMR